MIRRCLKSVGAGLAAASLVLGLASVAGADDFMVAPPDSDFQTLASGAEVIIGITLVAADDPNWNGDEPPAPPCDIRSGGHGNQHVTASVLSSNSSVADVSPSSLTYHDCGETQPITITAGECSVDPVTITIHATGSQTAGGPNASFSDEVITVTVTGNCGGGDLTTCAQPAAPAWAAAILQGNNVKAKDKSFGTWVSQVAQTMLPGASFPDYRPGHNPETDPVIAKSDQTAYADSVWAYLKLITGKTLPNGPSVVARPGWVCATTSAPTA